MTRFLWICLGGAAGTGARYLLSGWLLRVAGPGFPWGTLAVNVLGSFLLGLIMHVALATDLLSPTLRLALTTGVMGGFTTYSTFNYETLQYLQGSDWLLGLANLGITVVACLVAGGLGLFTGRLLAGG
jgi:CrcB protein